MYSGMKKVSSHGGIVRLKPLFSQVPLLIQLTDGQGGSHGSSCLPLSLCRFFTVIISYSVLYRFLPLSLHYISDVTHPAKAFLVDEIILKPKQMPASYSEMGSSSLFSLEP